MCIIYFGHSDLSVVTREQCVRREREIAIALSPSLSSHRAERRTERTTKEPFVYELILGPTILVASFPSSSTSTAAAAAVRWLSSQSLVRQTDKKMHETLILSRSESRTLPR